MARLSVLVCVVVFVFGALLADSICRAEEARLAPRLPDPRVWRPRIIKLQPAPNDKAFGAACHDDRYGTTIAWTDDFKQACEQAKKLGKLVFVMHVSGNFAREAFT
jgi:hypothetical protein